MPPKVASKSRRSHQTSSEIVLIYDILANKDQEDCVRAISKRLQNLAKNDASAVQKSFFIFVLKIVGLDKLVDKINWRQPAQSLGQLLDQLGEQSQKSLFLHELYLINQKSKFHQQFIKRLQNLLQVVIGDQISLASDTQILKTIYSSLQVISKCKMRNIRHCSVVMVSYILKSLQKYYNSLVKEKQIKKASKIIAYIDDKYLQQLIRPRLKDIDPKIREKSFQIVSQVLISLQQELLTTNRLHKFYTQTMAENKPKIVQLCLKSIAKIFKIDKQKLSNNSNRYLNAFASQIIKPLEQLSLLPNRNSCLAMDALLSIQNFNPGTNALKLRIIAKIFEIHGYQKFQQGLKKAVTIFFKSLLTHSSKQQICEHRSMLLVQITHLLQSINSTNLLQIILQQFFLFHTELFNFDEMFLLLLTEYYCQNQQNIHLNEKQLNIICTMICQFNQHLRNHKNVHDRQRLQISYNKLVLTNSKQFFYDKIPKHAALCSQYLRLFSLLYFPVQQEIDNFLSFVENKVLSIIKQEKFFTFSNGKASAMNQIIKTCAAVCQVIWKDNARNQAIQKNFQIHKLRQKQKFDEVDAIKTSVLVQKFFVKSLLTQEVFKKMVVLYNHVQQKFLKLSIISYCYHCHRHLFISLFNQPSLSKHESYSIIRNAFLGFIFQMVINSNSQEVTVKFAGFTAMCKTFRLISNNKISDLTAVYYQAKNHQLEIIYEFVGQFVKFEQQQVSQVSMMIANLGLEGQQIKDQIIVHLFQVFNQCLKIALNKQSLILITKLILTQSSFLRSSISHLNYFLQNLAKLETSNQNANKFMFWRLYHELLSEIPLQDQQVMDKVMSKLISCYYNRKAQPQTKAQMRNKLTLYIADSIDKIMNLQTYGRLRILKNLLQKVYRRYPKQILQRLYIFYTSKIGNVQDKQVQSMRDFLKKISKAADKKTKQKQDKQQQSSSASQNENSSNDENSQRQNYQKQNQQNIMSQKVPAITHQKYTRSKTKRKLK